jgi:hypothetical protein
MKNLLIAASAFVIVVCGVMLINTPVTAYDQTPNGPYGSASCEDMDLCEESIQTSCYVGETGAITSYHKGLMCAGKCCRQLASGSWTCRSTFMTLCM